jgi:hypothetical protein
VVARSKAWVGLPLAGWDCGFESRRGHGCVSCACCVLSGRGLCDGRLFAQGRLPSVCVCVCVCVTLSVIRYSNNPFNEYVEEGGQRKKQRGP